ncbi:MAG: MOSC domain-containing protein [Hyphomicrobiales bacterium]
MALLTTLPFRGKVEALLSRPSRAGGFEKTPQDRVDLSFAGPEDCHGGLTRESDSRTLPLYPRGIAIRNVRQVTLLSLEELAEIAARLAIPAIDPSWFGANLVVSGIPDFTLLPPSTRLQFPLGATLVVDMENMPCSQIAKVVEQHHPGTQFKVVEAAMHKRGVTAWVEREGLVAAGDAIKIVIPPNRLYPHAGQA